MKKPQEAQKARALWKIKAAKEAGEETCRQHQEKKRDKMSTLGRAPQRSGRGTGQSPEVCVERFYLRSRPEPQADGCHVMAGAGVLQSLWEKPIWEGGWHHLDPMDSVFLRTASMEWNVPGKYGPHGELFFFLIQKEPATVPDSETLSPVINSDIRTLLFSADVLKNCALVALRINADEGRDGDGFQVTSLVDEWKMGCPKSPMWEIQGERSLVGG